MILTILYKVKRRRSIFHALRSHVKILLFRLISGWISFTFRSPHTHPHVPIRVFRARSGAEIREPQRDSRGILQLWSVRSDPQDTPGSLISSMRVIHIPL